MWVSTNLFFTHNVINFLCKRIQWTKTFLAKYKKIERQSFVNSCGILYFFSKKKKGFDLNSAIDWNRDYIYIKYE